MKIFYIQPCASELDDTSPKAIENGDELIFTTTPEKAEFWSVYSMTEGAGSIHITDFQSRAEALAFAEDAKGNASNHVLEAFVDYPGQPERQYRIA